MFELLFYGWELVLYVFDYTSVDSFHEVLDAGIKVLSSHIPGFIMNINYILLYIGLKKGLKVSAKNPSWFQISYQQMLNFSSNTWGIWKFRYSFRWICFKI